MDEKKKSWVRVTRWVARIWSLGPILFALAHILTRDDNLVEPVPWMEWVTLSFAFIAVLGLALAWRWERLGGWIAVISLAVFTVLFLITVERYFPAVLINLVGLGVPAALYLISSYAES
jgi:cytochrome bd-type quinol oxidase subunit 2